MYSIVKYVILIPVLLNVNIFITGPDPRGQLITDPVGSGQMLSELFCGLLVLIQYTEHILSIKCIDKA